MTKLAVSVEEAAEMAGLSRSRLYQLFRSGDLAKRKQGARTLVLVKDLERYLETLPTAA